MSTQLLTNTASWSAEWNQIHSEREEICEELVRSSMGNLQKRMQNESLGRRLQARLRLLDDAMDRLIAGSFGHCESCGRHLNDERLQIDPAIAKRDVCEAESYH
ncbi:MAG TPA: hypothetical protein VFD63_16940 [Pyrinomonadaceae bacterium]|nr:hypothetical protein [Pyrinomonadaceae bacterium]